MLERLVQDYPSHGFVIDKDEAEKYFSHVDDFSGDELQIDAYFEDEVRLPKEQPESFDILDFIRFLVAKQSTVSSMNASEEATKAEGPDPSPETNEDAREEN